MANRQGRSPGRVLRFEETAQVSGDVPSWAVDTGQAFRALAQLAGGMGDQLGKLADEAAKREGIMAGLAAGASSGAAYLRQQAAEAAADGKAASDPSAMTRSMRGDIRKIVSDAAMRHGVDPNALLRIAMLESSGNPGAKNPNSSAGGLFQFVDSTAKAYGLADRFDPAAAADAAARLARDNAAHLRKVLGRDPTGAELYLAHQQGAGGAAKLLANPDARAADIVGADAVTLNGGSADMTAGEFAGLWLKKAGGSSPAVPRNAPPSTPIVATLPETPLQLRRDGTIYGEAYDRAAMSAHAWRMQAGVSNAMQAAFEANQEDPEALAGALAQVQDQFLQDPNLADPELREAFAKNFTERSEAYLRSARAKAEANMREEERAAVFEGMAAQRLEVERQAVALGANPEGDRIIEREVTRAGRAIDAAVASGSLSPAEGARQKEELGTTAALARARGVYEALGTSEEKEQFATALLEDWQEGKGPLAKLPYAQVKALSTTLWNDARAASNRKTAEQRIEAGRLRDRLDDDIASMEATGRGLEDIDPQSVDDLLGPGALADWQARRDVASRLWGATSGMETETPEEISARLAALEPQAGSEGFRDQERIFEAAAKKAQGILKARANDPAAAAEAAFPDVAKLSAEANVDDPVAMQAMVAARLQAQEALGIDEFSRQPLKNAEALSLARAVTQQVDPRAQAEAMAQLVDQVGAAYGPHADAVLRQVLEAKGMDKDMAAHGAALFARLNRGGRSTSADARRGGVLSETAAADASGRPRVSAGSPADAAPLPNYRQQQMLLEHPELAPQFDEKFGPGAAQRVLGPSAAMTFVEDRGTTTLRSDNSEDWQPAPGTERRPQPQPRRPITPTPTGSAAAVDPSRIHERFR